MVVRKQSQVVLSTPANQGFIDKYTHADGFSYWVRRARPEGHKNTMSKWLKADNLRISVDSNAYNLDCKRGHEIKRLIKQMRKRPYFRTLVGQRKWQEFWDGVAKARQDKVYQAFKAVLIPKRKNLDCAAISKATQS